MMIRNKYITATFTNYSGPSGRVRYEDKYLITGMEVKRSRRIGNDVSGGGGLRALAEIEVSVESDAEHPVVPQCRYEQILVLPLGQLLKRSPCRRLISESLCVSLSLPTKLIWASLALFLFSNILEQE